MLIVLLQIHSLIIAIFARYAPRIIGRMAERRIMGDTITDEEDKMVDLITKYQMQSASVAMSAFNDGYQLGKEYAMKALAKEQSA